MSVTYLVMLEGGKYDVGTCKDAETAIYRVQELSSLESYFLHGSLEDTIRSVGIEPFIDLVRRIENHGT